jgi:uncharacterized SAM-binding protein YcdF (DUF218 family)
MLYLDKLLAQLAYPLGLSLCLSLLGLLLLGRGWRRGGSGLVLLGIGWLWLWSMPIASDAIRLSLEGRFPHQPAEELPEADAVVILGGGISAGGPEAPYPNLGSAADRVWHAARIFHADKVPLVLSSGGSISWLESNTPSTDPTLQFLIDLGVPAESIVLEDRSRTTRENALYTAELLKERELQRVLLVTSAVHMPRAIATFQAAGVDVVPAATDFEVRTRPTHLLRRLPSAEALERSTGALKEYLGLWVYQWRGWAT